VTLTGQTRAALTTPLARASRAYVANGTFASPSSDLQGIVYVYDNTDGQSAGGVPTTAAATRLVIRGDNGVNQSEKCATSISSTDYWLITGVYCSIGKDGANTVTADFDIEVRQLGGVFRPVGTEISLRTTSTPTIQIVFEPHIIVRPNSDVRMVALSNSNDTRVAGRIRGVLASIS
jgi:hypothetical protein